MSVLMPETWCFDFVAKFWNWEMWALRLRSFSRLFWLFGAFAIPYILKNWHVHLYLKGCRNLEIAIDTLRRVAVLTMLSLCAWEPRISFRLFRIFYIVVSIVLYFLVYQSHSVKFVSRCFILLDSIINEIAFLISFLAYSWQVYRNTADFCLLILHPETLLNLLALVGWVFYFFYFL